MEEEREIERDISLQHALNCVQEEYSSLPNGEGEGEVEGDGVEREGEREKIIKKIQSRFIQFYSNPKEKTLQTLLSLSPDEMTKQDAQRLIFSPTSQDIK